MVICPNCLIEYEEGKKFCKKCGALLVAKQETLRNQVKIEDKPVMNLICPSCNLAYEQGKFCKKCGSALTQQPPYKEETLKPPTSEVKKEAQQVGIPQPKPIEKEEKPLICPKCRISYEAGKFCKKCGSSLVNQTSPPPKEERKAVTKPEVIRKLPKVIVPEKEEIKVTEKAEIKKEPPSAIIPEKPAIKKLPEEEGTKTLPTKAREKSLRPLLIAIIGIIVLIAIGGFFLWPKYSSLIKRKPPTTEQISKGSILPPPSPQTSAQALGGKEASEVIAIKTLLENIRQANLQKNIDLFMSCYSTDFKDREGRKKGTLENWENFNYSDLLFNLKSQTVSGDKANIKVEWIVRYSPMGGGKVQETKSVLDVSLKREDGIWRIQESKSAN
jgi:hypothetical protein